MIQKLVDTLLYSLEVKISRFFMVIIRMHKIHGFIQNLQYK